MKRGIFQLLLIVASSVFLKGAVVAEPYVYGQGDCCVSDCCDPCNAKRFWADAEYLYWQIKRSPNTPPLVVSSFDPILNEDSGDVVIGGSNRKNDWRSGGRFGLGYWFDECYGVEATYLFLGDKQTKQFVTSDGLLGSPFLSLPFITPVGGLSATAIALPGVFSGSASLKVKNHMQGAELNGLANLGNICDPFQFKLIAGFRWWNFDEDFTFHTESTNLVAPDVFITRDRFQAQNNFYGGQVGIEAEYNMCSFFAKLKAKVALGANCQELTIRGSLLTNDFAIPPATDVAEFAGGYLAQPSNIGKHKRTDFAVIPEFNFDIGYKFTDWMAVKVGYTFIYVNKVVWTGNNIDPVIDPASSVAISGSPIVAAGEFPRAQHRTRDFWVQGVSAGLEFNF